MWRAATSTVTAWPTSSRVPDQAAARTCAPSASSRRWHQEIAGFHAYDQIFGGGVRVAAADVNGDGMADIITGAGPRPADHMYVRSVSPAVASRMSPASTPTILRLRAGCYVAGG